jgi:nucleotide-binding universal stress UspA family protein
MNPWIVLLGLALLAVVFVLAPVGLTAFWHWRRPLRLTCPRAGTLAQVRVDATRAAIMSVLGGRATIERCSLWPSRHGCREECLALPADALVTMRPGEAPPRESPATGLRIVLVPLDGSPGSESVLPVVRELARARGATVRLLHVVAPLDSVRADDDRVVAYADQESARVEEETRAYFRRVARALVGVPVQHAVRFGEPAAQIVEEAEAAQADLIALATHRRHGLGRLLKGSVAGRLERATTIPLLLVPYGEPAAA